MDCGRYRLAGIYGDRMDRMAYAQWSLERLRGSEPCVVLASCAEAEYLARSGDVVISGCDGNLVTETVSLSTGERRPLTQFVPDVARICAGAGDLVDILAPREYHNRIGGDMYWYNAATGVLRDIYDSAVCARFAPTVEEQDDPFPESAPDDTLEEDDFSFDEPSDDDRPDVGIDEDADSEERPSVGEAAKAFREILEGVVLKPGSLSADIGKITLRLSEHMPTDRRTTDKTEAARKFLRSWPDRYTRSMRSMVVENAPSTAGAVMSIVMSSVLALEPFVRSRPSEAEVVEELPVGFKNVVFVLSDTFRTDESGPVAVASCVRLLGGRIGESVRVFVVSGRDYDVARTFRASVTLLNDSALDKAGRADCHVFLPGRYALFDTLVDERNAYLLRRLPVEEPKNLEFGECLVYRRGEWSYRDDVLPEMPRETVSIRVEREAESEDWMKGHARDWLEHRRIEAVRRRREEKEKARQEEEMKKRSESLRLWGEAEENAPKTTPEEERPRGEWDDLLEEALAEEVERDEKKSGEDGEKGERKSA